MAQQGSGYQARYKRILLKLSGEALSGWLSAAAICSVAPR
jgi:uridylate kinase